MVSIKRNRHKNEVMNKSVCFSAVILSTFLLFVSCKDNRRTSYISNRQENKELPVSDSIGQKTGKDSVSLPAKKYAHAATDTKEIGREEGTRTNKRNHVSKRLQDFRKRTVSKYFAGTLADSLSVGRAELKVPRGSMERAKILSITPLCKGELAHLPAGMVNVTADRSNPTVAAHSKDSIAGYRFLPHGEHFVHSPASITVPYDSTLIPQGYTAEDIHTYYYDELKAQWVMLRHKALDKDKELVMAEMLAYRIPFKEKVKAAINFWRFKACAPSQVMITPLKGGWQLYYPIGMLFHWRDKKQLGTSSSLK